ncbi:MAG: hypothetical protein EBU88_18600 [Acidobacteria bacterium]|nr:hypothetical protein [Acidobacteriota bacterium]
MAAFADLLSGHLTTGARRKFVHNALSRECAGGGDSRNRQKIKETWNAINKCRKALALNGGLLCQI